MKTRIVVWGNNAQDERTLLLLALRAADSQVDVYALPEQVVTDELEKQLMNDWRNGKDVELPEGTDKRTNELSVTESLLPDDLKTNRTDLITRAQTEWQFVVLSSKLNEAYRIQLEELKEKVGKLDKYESGVWDNLKEYWGKVQEQVRERNLFRQHSDSLKEGVNELFGRMKELRNTADKEFKSKSAEAKTAISEQLEALEARIEEGTRLNGIFDELKKLQSRFNKAKLTRGDRNGLYKRIDKAFKATKEKRFGAEAASDGNGPVQRLERRLQGLEGALGKMQRTVKRDEDDLKFQQRKIDTTDGQLEAQIRQAKMAMIEERLNSKREKLADIEKTKAELTAKLAKAKEKEERRQAAAAKKAEAKKRIAAEMKAAEEARSAEETAKLEAAAAKIQGKDVAAGTAAAAGVAAAAKASVQGPAEGHPLGQPEPQSSGTHLEEVSADALARVADDAAPTSDDTAVGSDNDTTAEAKRTEEAPAAAAPIAEAKASVQGPTEGHPLGQPEPQSSGTHLEEVSADALARVEENNEPSETETSASVRATDEASASTGLGSEAAIPPVAAEAAAELSTTTVDAPTGADAGDETAPATDAPSVASVELAATPDSEAAPAPAAVDPAQDAAEAAIALTATEPESLQPDIPPVAAAAAAELATDTPVPVAPSAGTETPGTAPAEEGSLLETAAELIGESLTDVVDTVKAVAGIFGERVSETLADLTGEEE